MDSIKLDTPNISLYTLGPLPSDVTPVNASLNSTHRSKTNFRLIPNKVIEGARHNDVQLDVEEDITSGADGYFDQDSEERSSVATEEGSTNRVKRQKSMWQKKESNSYATYFKPGVFFKFFLMHVLFFFLMGPFIVLLSPIFGIHVLKNQGFIGWNRTVFRQTLEYLAIGGFITIFYATETVGLEPTEVYMMCIAVIVRMINISSKYAYQSDYFLKLLHKRTLSREELTGEQDVGKWRAQEDDIIDEELTTSILRLEIDKPLFYFKFLGKTSPELKEKLTKKKNGEDICVMVEVQKNEAAEEDFPQSMVLRRTSRTDMSVTDRAFNMQGTKDLQLEISNIELKVNERRQYRKTLVPQTTIFATKNNSQSAKQEKPEDLGLCGYYLAFDLVKNAKCARNKHLLKICLVVGVIRALIPTFYRAYQIHYNGKDIPLFTDRPYFVAILFGTNAFFFWINIFMFGIVVEDIRTKICCLKQIGFLISPKKLSHFQARKLYPTLNIFDPLTLKTWANLRKLINDYGRNYLVRNNFKVTVVMLFYFIIVALLVLQMLEVFTTCKDPLLLIIFAFEVIVYFTIWFINIFGAAFINDQYKVHKNLLKKNKTIISDFQRLSHLYVGEHAIEPDNPIYKQGLKSMKQQLGEENFENKLIARAEKLSSMIDDTIEELDFEEINEPFTVMGIAIDYSLIKSVFVGVVSLTFAVAQSYIN